MADLMLTGTSVQANSTSISIYVSLEATTTGIGNTGLVAATLCAGYTRTRASRTPIVLSNLAGANSAYSSGGVFEVGSGSCGLYRLDVPDAAWADGVDGVTVSLTSQFTKPAHLYYALPTFDRLRCHLFNKVVEAQNCYTVQQVLSIVLAVLAGVTSSSGTILKTPNGSCTRVTATISSCNRTAMTLNPSPNV